MSQDDTFWFRVGYTLEQARERRQGQRRRFGASRSPRPESHRPLPRQAAVLTGAGAVAAALLRRSRSKVSSGDLLWAGAAGMGAALLRSSLRPWLEHGRGAEDSEPDPVADLLQGAGQGLVYGAIVEPWIPGPPALRGVAFGVAEYLAAPLGGMATILRAVSPQGRIPILRDLLSGALPEPRSLTDQVIFGLALGLLYRSRPVSRGISADV